MMHLTIRQKKMLTSRHLKLPLTERVNLPAPTVIQPSVQPGSETSNKTARIKDWLVTAAITLLMLTMAVSYLIIL